MHRRAVLRLLATLAAGLVLLVACGDDGGDEGDDRAGRDGSSASSGGGDQDGEGGEDAAGACGLLTTDEVAELLGQDVEDGEESEIGDDATSCEWATVEPSQAVGDPITLDVELGPLTDEVSGQIDEALAAEANEPLDLGDRAVLVCGLGADGDDCTSFDSIAVAVGDRYVEVDLGNWGYPQDYSEEEGVQITEDAARRVVDALA